MGRIPVCVVLLCHLSLVVGIQFKNQTRGDNEREKQGNLTQTVSYLPKDQGEFFNKRVLSLDYAARRRSSQPKPKQMLSSVGLHAFADNPERRSRKRNSPLASSSNLSRKFVRPLHQRKNSKNFWSTDYHGGIPSQKLTKVYPINHQTKEDVGRRFHNEGRNARYSPHYAAKICDPCNSVPWVPLLKVPDSYRKQRTHVTEIHPTPHDNLNLDFHGFATNTQNILIPPVPLVPSIEPIYDGTISSSFGLPIGNIPTSHGLLAPINVDKYPSNTIDYSNPFNYFSPHGLLDNHPFPELSPVPVVPIHDSGQFYQFDTVIPDLVPPPAKPVDVSKVVLTIEENSPDLRPPNPEPHPHNRPSKDLSADLSTVTHLSSAKDIKLKNHHKDVGKLEIVKSVPLAEFTTSVSTHQQDLPLYPPLQSESKDFYTQRPTTQHQQPTLNYHSLAPPEKPHLDFNSNKSDIASHLVPPPKPELHGESSAPKPLTNPSLSWLFSDHTAPPSDTKNADSVSSYSAEATEIASVVNNELRPVSPVPLPPPSSPAVQNRGNTKSKKIQIIIPYTTKNKNGHDNNAVESVQHEIYQPPVSEINALRDLATSSLPPSETSKDRKVIDGFDEQLKTENQQVLEDKSHKYLSEMHHIIASNIRELLKEEIEKSQGDQNYPLQNNIDNWTALEYSNHKTVNTKAPKEIISQAISVTSIPGTSISHWLLPSKKIPNEYFVTTPLPNFDEPITSVFRATNATVNSSPFTAKPYATTNIYNPTRRVTETPLQRQTNHEANYTEVEKAKTNNWGRLNENLVLPEARSKTRRIEQATTSGWDTNFYSFSGNEKVQIVTPISLTTQNNFTTTPFRRTTRHVPPTETPTTTTSTTTTTTTTKTTTSENITRKPLFLNRLNSTRLEKVSNVTLPLFRKFTYNSTAVKSGNASKSAVKVERTNNTVLVDKTPVIVLPKMETSSEDIVKVSSKNESLSINDIIPFRNKELPWESNSGSGEPAFQVARQRKSLIKQANLPKSKVVVTPT